MYVCLTLTFTGISSSRNESKHFTQLFHLRFPNIDENFHVFLCYFTDRVGCKCSSSMNNLQGEIGYMIEL